MDDNSDFPSADIDENSSIYNLAEHTLNLKVSLDNTLTSFRHGSELSTFYSPSQPHGSNSNHRSLSHTDLKPRQPRRQASASNFTHKASDSTAFMTPSKSSLPALPKSTSGHTLRLVAKRFYSNFTKITESIDPSSQITKEVYIQLLFSLNFLQTPSETIEANELYRVFKKFGNLDYLKSLLLGILKIKDESSLLKDNELEEIKNKFPLMHSNYFKSKKKELNVEQPVFSANMSPRPSISYKIIKKSNVVKENHVSIVNSLFDIQKNLEAKMEKNAEKINKEKYKECTFKPKINKKSKILDSSPTALKHKNSNSYISLKESKSPLHRTDTLYEYAEISRNSKKALLKAIDEKATEDCSRLLLSPRVKSFKPKEETPVKGMEDVINRMQKARAEKEWTSNMMQRGVVIGKKDKENFEKNIGKIAEISVKLPDGGIDKIKYLKGENLNYLVSEFCLKHKLTPDYHEKLVKTVIKALRSKENEE